MSTNIEHLDNVAVGDLVVMPFDPLTKDPLTSEHSNDSLPMELMPNYLDQAFLVEGWNAYTHMLLFFY